MNHSLDTLSRYCFVLSESVSGKLLFLTILTGSASLCSNEPGTFNNASRQYQSAMLPVPMFGHMNTCGEGHIVTSRNHSTPVFICIIYCDGS